jgi:hypothetical protein
MSDMERILRKEIPSLYVNSKDGVNWELPDASNGWKIIVGAVLAWEGSIDLSGYALERKTFYPLTAFVQEAGQYNAFNGSGQTVMYLVSSIPTNTLGIVYDLIQGVLPGFLSTGLPVIPGDREQEQWETVLFGQHTVNLINGTLATLGVCQPIVQNQFGSLSPTAADKLYVTKIVIPATLSSSIGDDLLIPAARIVIPGSIREEPKLEYMMRLKRSYELAGQK